MDEETKQKLLEELRKEYRVELKPLKDSPFSVKDILDKYYAEICERIDVPNDWRNQESIGNVIRKVMCYKYRVKSLKEVNPNKREQFRNDTAKFIKKFILEEE